ncbi:hypothetical protein MBANPS3_009241 [Mucor bainieri]
MANKKTDNSTNDKIENPSNVVRRLPYVDPRLSFSSHELDVEGKEDSIQSRRRKLPYVNPQFSFSSHELDVEGNEDRRLKCCTDMRYVYMRRHMEIHQDQV